MRHRNMYYATGLPGCMRLGYSPGWSRDGVRRMGPCAQYLASGQWPAQPMQAGQGPAPQAGVDALRRQAEGLRSQLAQLERQIEEMSKQ